MESTKLPKMATLIGLIGVSIIFLGQFTAFIRVAKYTDGLGIFLLVLSILGLGGLLAFFIMMFIHYQKQ